MDQFVQNEMSCPSLPQFEYEPFWVYFNRFEDFSNYLGCTLRESCEIIYWGLNEYTRGVVENKFNGEFRATSSDEAWDFYLWFARDSNEQDNYDNCRDFSNSCINSNDDSYVPHDDPLMHDGNPSLLYANCNEMHPNVDNVHDIFQCSSIMCMNSNDASHTQNSQMHNSSSSFPFSYTIPNEFPYVSNEPFCEGNSVGRSKEEECMEMLKEFMRKQDEERNEREAWIKMMESKISQLASSQEDAFPSSPSSHLSEPKGNQESETTHLEFENVIEDDDFESDGGSMDGEIFHDFVNTNPSTQFEPQNSSQPIDDTKLMQLNIDLRLLREKFGLGDDEIPMFIHGDLGNVNNDDHALVESEISQLVIENTSKIFEGIEDELEEKACDSMLGGVIEVVSAIPIQTPSTYIPFSRKFSNIPSFPISLPYFLKNKPIEEPLASLYHHGLTFDFNDELSPSKMQLNEFVPSFSFSYFNFSFDFSFDSFYFSFPPPLKHRVSFNFVLACHMSITYALFHEIFSDAYDKLLRSLSGYLLIRSILDLKQDFLGK